MGKKKTWLVYSIPLVMLAILLGLIATELRGPQNPFNKTIPTGSPLPAFELKNLWQIDQAFTDKDLPDGQVVLLHVWGSWCSACRQEHPILMYIKNTYHIPIYSLDYKDDPDDAKTWLSANGNPYVKTAMDPEGKVSHRLGVYGTPETFLIDKHGIIRYSHIGTLDKATWDQEIFPLIAQYKNAD
jgi:cytochrome c biogenesis protein CcmG/thiol:disulfide interchange protein DsbE